MMHHGKQVTADVLVIGGGNAALCAAMTAQEAGARVLVLESSPKCFRGGNSRHTRNLRYLHERGNDYLTGSYLEDEFWEDLMRVTAGHTNERLARLTIRESANFRRMDADSWLHVPAPLAWHSAFGKDQCSFSGRRQGLDERILCESTETRGRHSIRSRGHRPRHPRWQVHFRNTNVPGRSTAGASEKPRCGGRWISGKPCLAEGILGGSGGPLYRSGNSIQQGAHVEGAP